MSTPVGFFFLRKISDLAVQLHRWAWPAQMLNTALASVGHSSAPLLLTLYDQALISHPLETRVAKCAKAKRKKKQQPDEV